MGDKVVEMIKEQLKDYRIKITGYNYIIRCCKIYIQEAEEKREKFIKICKEHTNYIKFKNKEERK